MTSCKTRSPHIGSSFHRVLNRDAVTIVHIGPGPNFAGGIAGVIQTLSSRASLHPSLRARWIQTASRGDYSRKLLCFLSGVIKTLRLPSRPPSTVGHIHLASQGSFSRKYIIGAILRGKHIPYITHLHGGSFLQFWQSTSAPNRWRIRRFFSWSHRVVVLSSFWSRSLVREGLITDARQMSVIPNAVRVGTSPEWAEKRWNHIVFLGDIVRRKGILELLEASDILYREGTRFLLCLGGIVGTDQDVRERLSVAQGRPYVRFMGWLDDREKWQLLRGAGILALPSHVEGMPLAVLEGMSAGCAVVATRVGALPEVVPREVGILVNTGDLAGLRRALAYLLRNPRAAVERGRWARRLAEAKFSAETVWRKWEALYREVIGSRLRP